MLRTIVIGLDGANWNLINPWLEGGNLPHLRRLRESACWGGLESQLPTVTVPNWKCYSTGKNPGKFGVFRFDRLDLKNGRFLVHNSRSYRSKEIWDYLNRAGMRTGILNMPTTYPPRPIEGFMVAGGPDASVTEYRTIEKGYAYPKELEQYLQEKYQYRVHPDPLMSSKEDTGEEVEAILRLIDMRFTVAKDLIVREKLDFLHLTFFYTNVLQHFFWRGEPVLRAWRMIDRHIGNLLDAHPDINLILMSDHGSHPVDTVFFINKWLADEGYLKVSRSIEDLLLTLGITRESLLDVAKKLRLVSFLQKIVPEKLQRVVPWQEGARKGRVFDKIVLEKTKAIGCILGPIYLSVDKEVPEYEELKNDLVSRLEMLTSPLSGRKVAHKVYRAEEVYQGPYLPLAPDILIEQASGVHISDAVGRGPCFESQGKWEAENIRSGLFLAHGPDIAGPKRIDGSRIIDLAPTILHLMDVAVPEDMDGQVLKIFKKGSEPDIRDVRYQESIGHDSEQGDLEGDEEVIDRLQSLGYLS
jgi:predicted AlkP superfamily phosphohydrolase/phosphomutase